MKIEKDNEESLIVDSLAQMKALAEPIRYRIFELLALEARTAKQTAECMGLNSTRLYHHFGVLEKAGLIRRVKTRKKRGTTEKYSESVADKIVLDPNVLGQKVMSPSSLYTGVFQSTLKEIVKVENAADNAAQPPAIGVHRLRVRTTPAKARALEQQLEKWIERCNEATRGGGDTEYGVTVAFYEVANEPTEERVDES